METWYLFIYYTSVLAGTEARTYSK